MQSPSLALPFKISTLVFIEDSQGKHLLIKRNKKPNLGLWSPIGGKLEMSIGESPHQCAVREVEEEIQWKLEINDLHLFGMITERAYQGEQHWLMFLFHCLRPLNRHPQAIDEGSFDFFSTQELSSLEIPATDRKTLWQLYHQHRQGFVAGHIDCTSPEELKVSIEEIMGS